ncbi:beta-galactosidase [Sphingomonas sp. FW199]|uniref:beta-galactosidase n=1 Tax=Sphingomonas sp. FW199 TaxID=3400217 RepID=UPI003CEA5926
MRRGAFLVVAAMASTALPSAMAAAQTAAPTADFNAPVQQFGRVSFDARSLMIDGKRTVIWSSEMHHFRLPSPDLWRDVLQKMKASGFNTVAIYFDWGFHSPKRGVIDFSGIRDIDRLLKMAADEGLYVITRAGPYVNAELTRGGYPGYMLNQRARARTDDPEYLAAVDEWLTAVHAIIARHQINGGPNGERGGTVILHQIENELALTTPAQRRYMDHLYARARADGITVPIFHNDQGRNGYWVPKGAGVDTTVEGPVDLYAFDGYPGGTCTAEGIPTQAVPAPDWGYYGTGGARGGASASPKTPGFAAEFGGGWFDYWGSNGGYACNAIQRGRRYQRVFYGTNLANGIGIQSFYMGYGGTSWGWLPGPVVFTSYDYGAAIDEARGLRDKALELKQLGGLIGAVPDLAGMIPAAPVEKSSQDVRVYHNRSPETDARFLLVTQNPSNGSGDRRFTVTADLPDGRYTLPLRLDGYDAKWLVAGVDLARQRLVYSTSEVQHALRQGTRSLMLLYGRADEDGQTLLRYASAPRVTVLAGQVQHRFDAARGDLILDYRHDGLARVRIEGGGRPPLDLLIADEPEAMRFSVTSGVLVRGPLMVRSARVDGSRATLTGDAAIAGPIELWTPRRIGALRWNGTPLRVTGGIGGTALASIAGPADIALPQLANWRSAAGSPEAEPGFDDSGWQEIDDRPYTSITLRPDGQPNMSMDAYGFHDGDVWYRGRFAGGAQARRLTLHYGGGGAGMAQVFLDGKLIGHHDLPGGLPRPETMGVFTIDLPDAARADGDHVLSVMVRNNGHNWDLDADDFHKEARGIVFASIEGANGRNFAVPIRWRINGRRGGEDIADPARGVPNNGGLNGEGLGWHLPGFDDAGWTAATLPAAEARAGTTWYRTRFTLNVPKGQDATIGVQFGDGKTPRSPVAYRAILFVNGWNMGQFVAHIGPQRTFPVPEGILNHRGDNVIALAVTSDGAPSNAIEDVRLVTMHNVAGGLPVRAVPAPRVPGELK